MSDLFCIYRFGFVSVGDLTQFVLSHRVSEPPPGRRSGHWTGLLTLLATLKGLASLEVAHAHSVFPLTKCLSFRLTDKLASLDLSYLRVRTYALPHIPSTYTMHIQQIHNSNHRSRASTSSGS